jgi:hypothetical protein
MDRDEHRDSPESQGVSKKARLLFDFDLIDFFVPLRVLRDLRGFFDSEDC